MLDMAWHAPEAAAQTDVDAYQARVLTEMAFPPAIESLMRSTNLVHVFAGSFYAAGYYTYIWCSVLAADAFQAFKTKANIFDRELAASFRKHVLSPGDTEDAAQRYLYFRGTYPTVETLIAD